MTYIAMFKNLFPLKNQNVLLGRWNIVYCEKKINKKLDLSNEDHCGTCNQYNHKPEHQPQNKLKIDRVIFYETM